MNLFKLTVQVSSGRGLLDLIRRTGNSARMRQSNRDMSSGRGENLKYRSGSAIVLLAFFIAILTASQIPRVQDTKSADSTANFTHFLIIVVLSPV